jgi:hypothetical protein
MAAATLSVTERTARVGLCDFRSGREKMTEAAAILDIESEVRAAGRSVNQ